MAKKEENGADMGGNDGTLIELRELLEIYAGIPKDRRAVLLEAAKREAAGEILTDGNIAEEKKTLLRFFSGVKDNRKKKLIARKVDEVAFQAVTIRQAKESLIAEGLQAEVVNGKQRYPKENPAVTIYDKYCRAYQSNIDKLIELLPPKAVKEKSKLAALRDELD
ncbi:MAG: hypothetical protein NC548_26535 [Lachnospiraceae bacterium]|nr:hypothetical protein [Lachnospiraceae bacterium]